MAADRPDTTGLREALGAYVDESESGANEWGTCGHEWLSLRKLRALLAAHPTPEQSEADLTASDGCPDCPSIPRPCAVCPRAGEPDAGDVEALAEVLFAWNTPTDPYFVINGRGTCDGVDEDAYAPIARAILASDWLTSLLAATADQGRRRGDAERAAVVEGLAAEWDALSKGETGTTRRLRALLTSDHTKALDAEKAEAWGEGRWQGVIDAQRKHCTATEPGLRLLWVVVVSATDDNPYRADRLSNGSGT